MRKKYEFVPGKEQTIVDPFDGSTHVLHQIRAVQSFGDVKKGDLGGYIESEKNLSHMGTAWVDDSCKVYGNARVSGNARICCNSIISDNAKVYGSARVDGFSCVYDNAEVFGCALIDYACGVCGNARVHGHTEIYGFCSIHGNAQVYGKANITYGVTLCDNARVYDNAIVEVDNSWYEDHPDCKPESDFNLFCLSGDTQIHGHTKVIGDAVLRPNIKNIDYSGRLPAPSLEGVEFSADPLYARYGEMLGETVHKLRYAERNIAALPGELKNSLMDKLNRNKDAVGSGIKRDQDKAKEGVEHAER